MSTFSLPTRQVERHDLGLKQLSVNSVAVSVPEVSLQYCTEAWPSPTSRNIYDIVFLALVYVLPGSLTVFLYTRIGATLWAKDQALSRQNSFVTNESKMVSGVVSCRVVSCRVVCVLCCVWS